MFIKKIDNQNLAIKELVKLGCDPRGAAIMSGKMVLRIFKLKDLEVKASNILKQECLAVGADLALPKAASCFSAKKVSAVMMINLSQLKRLIVKLKMQPFGLKELGEKFEEIILNWGQLKMEIKGNKKKMFLDKPRIMGILNVTPDSLWGTAELIENQVELMLKEGVDIIEVGGESTGPGSEDVSLKEELKRVIPVIKIIRKLSKKVWISIDTWKAKVAEEAIKEGADFVNDVTALRGDKKMASVIKKYGVSICMMYSKDKTPRTTKIKVKYDDVVETIFNFLEERIELAIKKGVKKEQIIIDPGMGAFISGDPKYSFEVLTGLSSFKGIGLPILIGASRKFFLGGKVKDRKESSLAVGSVALYNGANILRVHDVKETIKAVKVMVNFKNVDSRECS